MVRAILAVSVCAAALGARLNHAKVKSFAREGEANDLQDYIESLGVNGTLALRIESIVEEHYPPAEYSDDDRRMKASHVLQIERHFEEFPEETSQILLREDEVVTKTQDQQVLRLHWPGDPDRTPVEGFLGPLKNTKCASGKALKSSGGSLQDCAKGCGSQCKVFSYRDGECEHFAQCVPGKSDAWWGEQHQLFVKNELGMTPHHLPSRKFSGTSGHIFVIGDWGSISSPNRQSMHYKWGKDVTDEQWKRDHEAQPNVAKQMGALGQQVKPFMVLNAGDNFYWGGIEKEAGGIYHKYWEEAFEQVYTDASLKVPWLGVLGNHDYGGQGCLADIGAQFDYTVKDMLLNNRWKIPSPYFNHVVEFDGFSAEFFMLDTNIDNAEYGYNNICEQSMCKHFHRTVTPEDCKSWFGQMWKDQGDWYDAALAASKADWKIVVMHHKPEGRIANRVIPGMQKHNVQLMVGSHTHELAFFDPWMESGKPLLVVGAGGGAQSNPHSGHTEVYRSPRHEYGFADLEISEQQMTVRLLNDYGKEVLSTNICRDGQVKPSCS